MHATDYSYEHVNIFLQEKMVTNGRYVLHATDPARDICSKMVMILK
jgi:hypothetical protein